MSEGFECLDMSSCQSSSMSLSWYFVAAAVSVGLMINHFALGLGLSVWVTFCVL